MAKKRGPARGRARFYVLDGHQPVEATAERWCALLRKIDARRVALSEFRNPARITVSTLFVGVDQDPSAKRPKLFETRIIVGNLSLDEWSTRCSTWAQAERLHKCAVRAVERLHRVV